LEASEKTFSIEQATTAHTTRAQVAEALRELYSNPLIVPVDEDGDCQFSSVLLAGAVIDADAEGLRTRCVAWMCVNEEKFKPFLVQDTEDGLGAEDWGEYLVRMSTVGEWGDNLTLQAVRVCV